ncbi:transposase [Streptomyces sp. MUSC 14]|uniref:transposase n=1 Tax=Streptomyces sp. MUSC 14 TaxID=1354889 RepID=UPI0015A55A7A
MSGPPPSDQRNHPLAGHWLATGCQWRQLPARLGPWQTIHKRNMLWSADRTWERLLQHVRALAEATVTSTGTSTSTPPSSGPTSTPSAPRRGRRSYGPFSRRADHEDLPERRRQTPTVLPHPLARATGGLHTLRVRHGQDPRPWTRRGPTTSTAGQRRRRRGIQQLPDLRASS